ncbi:hypothetical protein AJ88_35370 [Mesorhizobium amorphae CCBAU 01583]|nr:hypothetical protein AJ88_35370 [Mesorhizobium amorphae CCBAU 01583]
MKGSVCGCYSHQFIGEIFAAVRWHVPYAFGPVHYAAGIGCADLELGFEADTFVPRQTGRLVYPLEKPAFLQGVEETVGERNHHAEHD